MKDAFALVGSVDLALANWMTGTSTVSAVYNRRPEYEQVNRYVLSCCPVQLMTWGLVLAFSAF